MAVPTVNVTCTVTNQTGAVVAGATVTAQLTALDVYGTNYIFPSVQTFVTDVNGFVTMPLFPNALGARRTAYTFKAVDPVTGRPLINITAIVPNQNIDLSVLDAIGQLPAYAPPLTQPYSMTLASLASLGVVVGSILFGGPGQSVLQDSANLVWDNVNKRLGIGNAAPTVALDVTGAAKVGGTLNAAGARVLVNGGGIPRVDFSPSAGNTRTGSLTQQGDSLIFASDLANLMALNLSTGNVSGIPTLTATTSVVTPLIGTATATVVSLMYNGASVVDFTSGNFNPNVDNATNLGVNTKRWLQICTPIIDSGTTGSLSLRTNNGTEQVRVFHLASAVNALGLQGNAAGFGPFVLAFGTDTDIALNLQSKGAGNINFFADAGSTTQFQILRTASASRSITVTGSNGGNPTIGVTAGGLDISPATVRFPNIGTTAVAANATLNAVGSNDLLRSTSSKRYKTEIEALSRDEAVALLRKLSPVTYASICEQDDPWARHSGFIAEDVHAINPLFVSFSRDDEGNKRPESVQYERLTVPLVAGWQDHETRLAALEARIH